MEHDATELTAEERRIFAEIERGVQDQSPTSWRDRLRRRRGGPASRRWWFVVLLGSALVAGGLWFDAVVLAAMGFLAVVIGLSRAVPTGVTGRALACLRSRLARLGTAGHDDG
jgi:hypothetical protein